MEKNLMADVAEQLTKQMLLNKRFCQKLKEGAEVGITSINNEDGSVTIKAFPIERE